MPEKPNPEDDIFEEALLKAPGAERVAFLDRACRNQPEFRARLEMMVEGHLSAEGFLDTVPERVAPQGMNASAESAAFDQPGSSSTAGFSLTRQRLGMLVDEERSALAITWSEGLWIRKADMPTKRFGISIAELGRSLGCFAVFGFSYPLDLREIAMGSRPDACTIPRSGGYRAGIQRVSRGYPEGGSLWRETNAVLRLAASLWRATP